MSAVMYDNLLLNKKSCNNIVTETESAGWPVEEEFYLPLVTLLKSSWLLVYDAVSLKVCPFIVNHRCFFSRRYSNSTLVQTSINTYKQGRVTSEEWLISIRHDTYGWKAYDLKMTIV